MVGTIAQLEKDLAALDEKVALLADELYAGYQSYLSALGAAVRHQLIMACYYLCTQSYPEHFLGLTYKQRDRLQQHLRAVAQQTQEELMAQLHPATVIEVAPEPEEDTDPDDGLRSQPLELPAADTPTPDMIALAPQEASPKKESDRRLRPKDVIHWVQNLEMSVQTELQTASHAVNRLLQQANIISPVLPEALFEAANRAEIGEMGNIPNILNVMLDPINETLTNKEPPDRAVKRHQMIQILAIHLRLSDLEFADPALTQERHQLRQLAQRLKTLKQDYKIKRKDYAIAQAQSVWKSSWVDD